MTSGHFDKGYWKFLKLIAANGGTPCEDKPDLFFPEDIGDPEIRKESIAEALAICESCPLREACLSHAIKSGERFGIWGGTLASER